MRKVFLCVLVAILLFRIVSSFNDPMEGRKVRITGYLYSEPREYESSLLVNLQDYTFFIKRDSKVNYGSHLVVEGVVVKGRKLEDVEVISARSGTSLLTKVRIRILSVIRQTLPEPESSLVAGIALGVPNIPRLFKDALRTTGTSHVVVASGGNLAILAGFLEVFLARFMKRKLFLPIIALVLLLYSALTGFGSPVVRALVMWLVVMAAQLTGRAIKTWHVLMFTVVVMLIYKPLWIVDVSFQLSVGATAGIMLLTKPIEVKVNRLRILKDAFATSLAAQIGTLPITVFAFGEVNLLAPIWNTLVLWVVPYITIIGLFGGVLSLLSEQLGRAIFMLDYPFAWYFVKVVSF